MINFLTTHTARSPISFHMPGHKGSEIFRRYGYDHILRQLVDMDVTEIPGADNLFQTEGVIKELQERYAVLYGARRSYLLINGSSGGLIASILATVPEGGKLIMARNCHKSIFNALALGGVNPVYARPALLEEHGVLGPVTPEEIRRRLAEHPDANAVILPSPNYYGICSDVKAIAEVVHAAGKILIVDQAHGAHLKFFHAFGFGRHMPEAAEDQGADLVVASTHKTLASLTQSAVLNVCSDRVDRYMLEDKLQAVQSTSPSYLLMSFLDVNAEILEKHGAEAIGAWQTALDYFYGEVSAIAGLRLITPDTLPSHVLDPSKINLNMRLLGLSGADLERRLMDHCIYPELYTGDILMLMTGIGNTRLHMEKTIQALRAIAEVQKLSIADPQHIMEGNTRNASPPTRSPISPPHSVPLHPAPVKKTWIKLTAAGGRICAGSIIPYPPGIPLVCPGEEITLEIIDCIMELRAHGEKVIGLNDQNQVSVGV